MAMLAISVLDPSPAKATIERKSVVARGEQMLDGEEDIRIVLYRVEDDRLSGFFTFLLSSVEIADEKVRLFS